MRTALLVLAVLLLAHATKDVKASPRFTGTMGKGSTSARKHTKASSDDPIPVQFSSLKTMHLEKMKSLTSRPPPLLHRAKNAGVGSKDFGKSRNGVLDNPSSSQGTRERTQSQQTSANDVSDDDLPTDNAPRENGDAARYHNNVSESDENVGSHTTGNVSESDESTGSHTTGNVSESDESTGGHKAVNRAVNMLHQKRSGTDTTTSEAVTAKEVTMSESSANSEQNNEPARTELLEVNDVTNVPKLKENNGGRDAFDRTENVTQRETQAAGSITKAAQSSVGQVVDETTIQSKRAIKSPGVGGREEVGDVEKHPSNVSGSVEHMDSQEDTSTSESTKVVEVANGKSDTESKHTKPSITANQAATEVVQKFGENNRTESSSTRMAIAPAKAFPKNVRGDTRKALQHEKSGIESTTKTKTAKIEQEDGSSLRGNAEAKPIGAYGQVYPGTDASNEGDAERQDEDTNDGTVGGENIDWKQKVKTFPWNCILIVTFVVLVVCMVVFCCKFYKIRTSGQARSRDTTVFL